MDVLKTMRTPEIDQLVLEEFARRSQSHSPQWSADDWIALSCIQALSNSGHAGEFRAFAERRIREIKEAQEREWVSKMVGQVLEGQDQEKQPK
jgi:hypothetical protein